MHPAHLQQACERVWWTREAFFPPKEQLPLCTGTLTSRMIAGGRWGHKPKNKTLTNTHTLTHNKTRKLEILPAALQSRVRIAKRISAARFVSRTTQQPQCAPGSTVQHEMRQRAVAERARSTRACKGNRCGRPPIHGNAPHVSHTFSPADSSPGWTGGFSGGASLQFGGDFSRTLPR